MQLCMAVCPVSAKQMAVMPVATKSLSARISAQCGTALGRKPASRPGEARWHRYRPSCARRSASLLQKIGAELYMAEGVGKCGAAFLDAAAAPASRAGRRLIRRPRADEGPRRSLGSERPRPLPATRTALAVADRISIPAELSGLLNLMQSSAREQYDGRLPNGNQQPHG